MTKATFHAALLAAVTAAASASAFADNDVGHCTAEMLHGRYVYNAMGFTRPEPSGPGTPWVPKAILQVMSFNGEGAVATPKITVANAFGDTGGLLAPPAGGAVGAYIVNEDCTGKIHFFDAVGVMYSIFVTPGGDTIYMIQINPLNNVSQGSAKRIP
jgi:hypothetical protein